MTYSINHDGTVSALSCPDIVMCQGQVMSNNNGSFHAISRSQLNKLFDND